MTARNLLQPEQARQEEAKQRLMHQLFHVSRPVTALSVALLAATAVLGSTINTISYMNSISAALPMASHRIALGNSLNTRALALAPSLSAESGEVLGASISAPVPSAAAPVSTAVVTSTIASMVNGQIKRYLSQGLLTGPAGPQGPQGPAGSSGVVQNGNGQTTAVISDSPIVTYIPSDSADDFTGGSIAGFSNLSSGNLTTQTANIQGTLTVQGSASITGGLSAGTTTASSLTSLGNINFSGNLYQNGTLFTTSTSSQWTTLGSNIYYNTGNVGIGTTTPAQFLSVAGNMSLTGALFDSTNASGTLGMLLETTGSGTKWVATSTLGITGGGGVTGGANGKVAVFTSATTLGTGDLLDNLTVSGVNATSSTVNFNIRGTGNLNPFNVASSSGTSLLTVLANGNVGIGTATPAAPLDVEGSGSLANFGGGGSSVVNINNTSGINPLEIHSANAIGIEDYTHSNTNFRGPEIYLERSEGTQSAPLVVKSGDALGYLGWEGYTGSAYSTAGGIEMYASSNWSTTTQTSQMEFDTSGGFMYLNQFGDLGIGSSSPGSTLSLQGTGGTNPLYIASSTGAGLMVIQQNGNVGIGTSTPTGALVVQPASDSTTAMQFDNHAGTPLMNVDTTDGYVGIGTTTPIANLQIVANNGNGALWLTGGGGGADWMRFDRAGVSSYAIGAGAGNFNIRDVTDSLIPFSIQQGGNIGIGNTAPAYTLDVRGSGTTSPFNIASSSGTSELMVASNGFVGIGTTSPAATLDIYGTASPGFQTTRTGSANSSTRSVANFVNETSSATGADGLGVGINLDVNLNGTINTMAAVKGIRTGADNSGRLALMSFNAGSGLEAMDIMPGGNVGIGTTSPIASLAIQGSGSANPFVVASSTGTQLLNVSTAGALTASDYPNCSGFTTNSSGLIQCTASDERLKQEITPLGTASGLAAINALNPVSFYWQDPSRGTTEQFGFIAQQVQQIFPNLVSTTSPTALTPGGTLTLNYDGLISPLILATQELSASSTAMQSAISTIQNQVSNLQNSFGGNATSTGLTVYSPSDFSGDSVGEAEIPAGQTSVRVMFSQPYAFQPIVTFSPEGEFVPAFIAEKDSTGFTLDLEAATTNAVTFDWHAFASPTEHLTVGGSTAQAITLVVATSTSTTDRPSIASADSASSSTETATESDSSATGTPDVVATSTPPSVQDSGDSTTTASTASSSTPRLATPTPTPTASPTPMPSAVPSPSPTSTPTAPTPSADSGTSADQGSGSGS